MKPNWKKRGNIGNSEWFSWGDAKALLDCEGGIWHVSVSLPNRYPTWEEIKSAWYELVPDAVTKRTGAIYLPPANEFVNIHPNCFHVYEVKDSGSLQ